MADDILGRSLEEKTGELRLTYELREGLTAGPREGDETAKWWLRLANLGDPTQRVAAFIVLLNMGVAVRISLTGRGAE